MGEATPCSFDSWNGYQGCEMREFACFAPLVGTCFVLPIDQGHEHPLQVQGAIVMSGEAVTRFEAALETASRCING